MCSLQHLSCWIFLIIGISAVTSEITLKDEDTPLVTLPEGTVTGSFKDSRDGRKVYSFFDIPYAKPPKRWAMPEPAEKYEAEIDGTRSRSVCPQAFPGLQFDQIFGFEGTEDCLHANVYVPVDAYQKKKGAMDVLVLIHAGMFIFGYGNMFRPLYMMDEDVVFVSFNYRLGALGFLATGDEVVPANLGMHDQLLALQWIQKNIDRFGGDPKKVTVIGLSAGACMAHMLMLSPLSKGLFSKVILHSGTALSPWALEKHAPRTAKEFALEFNCTTATTKEMVDCMMGVPAEDIISKQLARKWILSFTHRFLPTIEPKGAKPILADWPENLLAAGKYDNMPMVIGGIERDGLVGSALILEDEHLIADFNANWTTVAPYALMFDEDAEDHLTDEERAKISKKIRDFYFGDKLIGKETLDNLTHLYSDFWFIRGIEKTATLHAKHGAQVYPYMFSFKGHYSFLHLSGITEHNEPTHGDDALYLFSTGFTPDLHKHPTEEEFSRKFVKLWWSFVDTGKPHATFGSAKDWHPLDPKEYPIKWYNVDEDTRYEEYPYEQRVKFWEEIIGSHFKLS